MSEIQKESVSSLLLRMAFDGQELSTGTGFVVISSNQPYLITNRHNVTGRDNITGELLSKKTGAVPNELVIVHLKGSSPVEWIEKTEKLFREDGTPRWHEHPTLKERADFVALPLTYSPDIMLAPYDVTNRNAPKMVLAPTETVSVLGFPFGKTAGGNYAIWATGFVASEPSVDYLDLPVLLIDCRSRPGQSGSPVIAFRHGGAIRTEGGNMDFHAGDVSFFVGIYSGRISAESDIGMVWKASAIRELIDSLPKPTPNYGNRAISPTPRLVR